VDYKKIFLSDIGYNLIGESIEVSLLPQTISEIKAIPMELMLQCRSCGYTNAVNIDPLDYLLNGVKLCTKAKCPECKEKTLSSIFSNFINCYTIQAIHPLKDIRMDHKEKVENKVKIIEESRTIKPITTYYLTELNEEVTFGVLKAKGSLNVDINKRPMKYFLIVNEITPEKDYFINYKITKKDREDFKKYFSDNENLESIISDTIAPSIIGRDLPKFFTALTQHSPLYIRPDSLGILSVLFVGDSRCGKTVILLDTILQLSPVGCEYATAETATRTGISYTLKQVGDSWEIEWGILPLCDKMLVGLDGLHAWGIEEIMQLREVRSQGYIRVRRSVKADSPARVRTLGAVNLTQKVAMYPTRWHSTWDSSILNHVDRNRWDSIFVFGETDINKADINKRHREYKEGNIKREIPADVWRKHVIWVWQLTPDRIKITEGTYAKIEYIVNEIHDKFRKSKIKPFTNDFFITFEKMTVAYACLCHSVDEDDNLLVKPEHADAIKEKIYEYMNHLELDKVKLSEEFIPLDELEKLLIQLQDTNKEKIFLYIGNNRACKQIDIANSVSMDKGNVSKEINWFQENHLISSRTKITLTETGAELYRKLLDAKVVTTNLTTNNEENGVKNYSASFSSCEKSCNNFLIEDIYKVMIKHPVKEWYYTEIAKEMNLSTNKGKELINFLNSLTANPNNDTGINRGKTEGYFHLTKITNKVGVNQ
jgi:hypothetical protein